MALSSIVHRLGRSGAAVAGARRLSTAAPTIVCSDPIDGVAVETLSRHGFNVVQGDAASISQAELHELVAGAQGLIVRS